MGFQVQWFKKANDHRYSLMIDTVSIIKQNGKCFCNESDKVVLVYPSFYYVLI